MSRWEGQLPPIIADALAQHPDEQVDLFMAHLVGGTSCNYLSDWLTRAGTPVSATTLKKYRQTLKERRLA